MNDWLVANLDVTFKDFSVLVTLLGSLVLNVCLVLDRRAAKTIALNNATIKNLETSLASLRLSLANAISQAECAKGDAERTQNDLENVSAGVVELHDKISELEKFISERPSLVRWGETMYREAFPSDPEHPILYCAACWDEKRWLIPVKKHEGQTFPCENWREPWHRGK